MLTPSVVPVLFVPPSVVASGWWAPPSVGRGGPSPVHD